MNCAFCTVSAFGDEPCLDPEDGNLFAEVLDNFQHSIAAYPRKPELQIEMQR
jgi:hypothetical protein